MRHFASPVVRVLAILASSCLVVAFALAVSMPPGFSLAQLILRWHPGGAAALDAVTSGDSGWTWRALVAPMLGRPAWLVPVDLALVMGGIAGSIMLRRARAVERRQE